MTNIPCNVSLLHRENSYIKPSEGSILYSFLLPKCCGIANCMVEACQNSVVQHGHLDQDCPEATLLLDHSD
uniref:Uncharacterized protein n=1 Tax=Populus trichocarpa TaxID=3694 RepID=U5GKE8_POPTR